MRKSKKAPNSDKPSERGFQKLDPERRREIASAGGKAAQKSGRAHKFTADEVHRGGVAGGAATSAKPGHMSEIGRLGGLARHRK